MIHLHHLTGCAPTPLAHYLKAIGILRLVAQQKDPEARGFWRDQHFCLLTTLDRAALESFFLDEYAPTAVFNPWGARSGFYDGSSETTARKRLKTLEASTTPRLGTFRHSMQDVRRALAQLGGAKPSDDDSKARVIEDIRHMVRGTAEEWIDTVTTIVAESPEHPALMGTEGNEGSGGYASAYFQSVIDCVLWKNRHGAIQHLKHALFGAAECRPGHAWSETFGQFAPDGNGFAWDFLLAFEGAVVFRSAVTRRSETGSPDRLLASPFYLPHHAFGSASDAPIDEYTVQKGRPNPGRGEQWFPLWSTAASFQEISATISDGRCSSGRHAARRPLDAARAIGQAGVTRGISSFVRYGFLQRNNLATHFAVPLDIVPVRESPRSQLLNETSAWLDRIHREARKKGAPARTVFAERKLAQAMFLALRSNAPSAWQELLSACASIEGLHASGAGYGAGPCPPLSPGWLDAAADDSPEWRLALSLGCAAGGYKDGRPFDTVRAHALPIDPKKRWSYATGADKRLVNDPRVVMAGRDPLADLIALVERRLVEASQRGSRTLPLRAAYGAGARLEDLARFLAGELDIERIVGLARALMAVAWEHVRLPATGARGRGDRPDDAWVALRLCALPFPVRDRTIAAEPAMFRRLASGDATGAVDVALRRLRASGYRPPISTAIVEPATARFWAAAFAFPLSPAVATAMADHFENPSTTENA